MANKPVYALLILSILTCVFQAGSEIITLQKVLDNVQEHNLELHMLAGEIKASGELTRQAHALPNPELEGEVEGVTAEEIAVFVKQTFELGGKRKNRIRLAGHAEKKAQFSHEERVLALKAEAIRRYLPLPALKAKLLMLDSLLANAQAIADAIKRRVEAGASRRIDLVRARMTVKELVLDKKQIKHQFRQKIAHLYALWSANPPENAGVSEMLNTSLQLPERELYRASVQSLPAMRMLRLAQTLKQTELQQARSEIRPDLVLSAGYKRNNAAGEHAPVIGVGMDVPLFNQNKGTQAALRHEQALLDLQLKQSLSGIHAHLEQVRLRIE
ncbi:MAG: hypothetical protein GF398_20255 [Chitinivibrionales bacterium]|nr:hypothetical protein [Chitinivibrionales bacterium]